MSKILRYTTLLIFFICAQISFAQYAVSFSENGLKAALEKGKLENKPVMLWCYATWCPHCKYMREQVFPNTTVGNFFNKTFICVAQDMEKGEGIDLNKEVKISSFPTFIFYNSTGEIIYRVEGELKQAAFIQEGKNALTQKFQFPYLKRQFEKDESSSNACYNYVRALKKGGVDVSEVVNRYFATQKDNQLLSEINWRIFANGVSDFNSREFRFVISHQKEFANIASPERVKRKLDYEVKALLNPLVEASDTANYRIKRELALQIHSYSADSLVFNYDLMLYELTQNWKMYIKISLESADIFAWNKPTQLSDILKNVLNNCNESTTLNHAERWAKRILVLNQSYDNFLICSRLYQKLHKIPVAIKMAQNANNLAIKFGWEGVEAEKLLDELKK